LSTTAPDGAAAVTTGTEGMFLNRRSLRTEWTMIPVEQKCESSYISGTYACTPAATLLTRKQREDTLVNSPFRLLGSPSCPSSKSDHISSDWTIIGRPMSVSVEGGGGGRRRKGKEYGKYVRRKVELTCFGSNRCAAPTAAPNE
jgi:hypothetical protein